MCLLSKMSNTLRVIIISIIVSLISVSLSKIGYINLVWIAVIVLMMTENESLAIPTALVGGIFYDVMMHNSIGVTSLCILVGVVAFLLFRAAVSGDNLVFRIISLLLLLVVAFAAEAGVSILTEGTTFSSFSDFIYWWKYVITHALLVGVFISILGGMRGVINSEEKLN